MNFTDYQWTDWLNPILVREARQGLRERLFSGGLLVLLITLGVIVIYRCEDPDNSLVDDNTYVWILFVFALPLRAFFSSNIAREIDDQTFEGLVLSKLSIRSILYGKWISSVFQSLLITTIFMPFFIVQYWMGGDDVLANLSFLFQAFFLGGTLTALAIALSAIELPLLRYGSLLLVGGCFELFRWALLINSVWLDGYLFFILPWLIFEIVVPHIEIKESRPLRRRLGFFLAYLISFIFAAYVDGSFVMFFLLFVFAFLLEPLQPTGLKNSSRWYLIRCWFAQEELSGFISMLSAVAIGVIALFSYRIFGSHEIELSEAPEFVPFLYITLISYMLFPLLIAELLSTWIPWRTLSAGLTNAILYGFFNLIHQTAYPAQYPFIYSVFPSSLLFLGFRDDHMLRGCIFSDFIAFLLVSSLYLWRKSIPLNQN